MSVKRKILGALIMQALLLLLCPCFLFSQHVSIQGVTNSDSSMVFISYLSKNNVLIDSIAIKDKRFHTAVNISDDKKYRLTFSKEGGDHFDFYSTSPVSRLFLEKGIKTSVVQNPSSLQKDFLRHQKFEDNFWKENKRFTDIPPNYSEIDINEIAKKEKQRDSIHNLRITKELQYFRNNPNSMSSLESMELLLKRKYGRARYKDFKDVVELIPLDLARTPYATSITNFIDILDKYHALKVFPSVRALGLNNEIIDTRKVAQGKYLLIDFWASWCIPCRDDHPELIKFYNENKDKLEVLQFSIDENTDLWHEAILEDHLELWKHISVKENNLNTIRRDLLVFSIPVKILVGPHGQIIKRWEGSNDIFFNELRAIVQK